MFAAAQRRASAVGWSRPVGRPCPGEILVIGRTIYGRSLTHWRRCGGLSWRSSCYQNLTESRNCGCGGVRQSLLRQVTLRDQPVELSPREFALLCALLMLPGVVRNRSELLRMAWPPFSGGPRSVDTQVLTLRRKLEQAGLGEGGGIETARQQGYRFSLDTIRRRRRPPQLLALRSIADFF